MKAPFRVGQKVKIINTECGYFGDIGIVESVIKNLLPVKCYGRKRQPKFTIWVKPDGCMSSTEFWPHELDKIKSRGGR